MRLGALEGCGHAGRARRLGEDAALDLGCVLDGWGMRMCGLWMRCLMVFGG